MGRKRTSGLYLRKSTWQIDKVIDGIRLCESTGTSEIEEAERYLAKRIKEIRDAKLYGIRPRRTWREAATKFLLENQHLRSIQTYAWAIETLDEFIGDLALEDVHKGTLQACIEAKKLAGNKERTINYLLQTVRRIVNLAEEEWVDEHGLSWLAKAPKIKLLKGKDKKPPQPITWEEQDRLFVLLPEHYQLMALFKVNTGTREMEVCRLRWEYEVKIPVLGTSVFIVPKELVKNEQDRLIVLNQAAMSVIEQVRGQHPVYVFTYKGQPLSRINNKAWRKAREEAGLPHLRVHDLKHTFGRRLRSAGVSFEDRQDLLGHKSSRMTTHYSEAEIGCLIAAANSVLKLQRNTPVLRVIKQVVNG
jgi:integrase